MADTKNATVDVAQGYSYVKYSGSIDLTGNLEDSHYTQAFLLAEANQTDGGYFSEASGGTAAGDVQVFLEVSNDKENWVTVSTAVADHDDTAEQSALLGDSNSAEFHSYKWGRLQADGLASNDYTTIDWSLVLHKNDGIAGLDNGTTIGGNAEDSTD